MVEKRPPNYAVLIVDWPIISQILGPHYDFLGLFELAGPLLPADKRSRATESRHFRLYIFISGEFEFQSIITEEKFLN